MGEERLRRVIEYIDSRVKRLEEEISLLKGLREIMEDKVRRLSVEPSMEEVPAILSSEVRWRSYPSGEGEWCFADELPRSFVEELRRKGVMDLDGYRYVYKRLSSGKEIVARRAR
jgi:hypothetical protein